MLKNYLRKKRWKKKIHFPNASGKSSPLFPKAMSPLTVMWRNWRDRPAARQVGGVLKRLPEGSTLPWHRVVNRHGTISLTGPDLQRQRQALLAEGVMVSGSGQIDLQRYRWNY
nr:hypothetical protein [Escherichia coli]